MLSGKNILAYAVAICMATGGLVLAGAPAASAESGPPQPYEEDDSSIGVPIFGLIAIAGIATIAIWQGVKDSKKKKEAQRKKDEELQEEEEFEEYFDFGTPESEAGESTAPDSGAAPVDSAAAAAE